MNALSQAFRKEAAEVHAAAAKLLESPDLKHDPQNQIHATVGFVAAKMYGALADLVAALREGDELDDLTERRKAKFKEMDDIRTAAARATAEGDWDEFDRLTGISGGDEPS